MDKELDLCSCHHMDKTLVLIMAAGYGTRMGPISVPKVMLKDKTGRHFIEDALTFVDPESKAFDYALLSRNEPFFEPLNTFIKEKYRDSEIALHFQKSKGRDHVFAFLFEYFSNKEFKSLVKSYKHVVLLPGDHALTNNDLNLEELLPVHDQLNGVATLVYSKGWGQDTARKDVLFLNPDQRIISIQRVEPNSYTLKSSEVAATSTGIWVFNRKKATNLWNFLPAMIVFSLSKRFLNTSAIFAYFMKEGWTGGRDKKQED